jgi:hypothetical protein
MPEDCVSHTLGKEKAKDKLVGCTISINHATGLIFAEYQASLRAGNTLISTKAFERWADHSAGVKIKKYHASSGIFVSKAFEDHVEATEQTSDFSGTGAHHQNGVAERGIRTVTEWARTMLLHAVLHWPQEVDLDLWPFAMDHAIYLWNHLPNPDLGVSPVELFTSQIFENYDFLKTVQVFGCPAYVLDPTLQDSKKLPKWVPRTRRGQYLGVAMRHSSTIGRIRNLNTGHVSPQFHVVYDPFFTTVPNAEDPDLADVDNINVDSLLDTISGRGQREHFEIEDIDERGNVLPQPELDIEWLTQHEREQRQRARHRFGPINRIPRPAPTNEGVADDVIQNDPPIVAPNDGGNVTSDSDDDEGRRGQCPGNAVR